MSRVVRVDRGDYLLSVQPGGKIVLDPGECSGSVEITGYLEGFDCLLDRTLAVQSKNRTVKNIIYIPYEEYIMLEEPDPTTLYLAI